MTSHPPDHAWPVPLGLRPRLEWTAHWQHRRGRHSFLLPDLWTLHLVQYEADFTAGDVATRLMPGWLVLMPPGIRTTTDFTHDATHYFAHFRFDSQGNPAKAGSSPVLPDKVPAFLDPGAQAGFFEGRFVEIVQAWASDRPKAEVLLWGLLYHLRDAAADVDAKRMHPKVRRACEFIEHWLSTRFTVADLCLRIEMSEPHLVRLFQSHFGKTVIGYVNGRRLERARHLLIHSSLTISEIVRDTGMGDLQHFNKSIRRTYGVGPRELRRRPKGLSTAHTPPDGRNRSQGEEHHPL